MEDRMGWCWSLVSCFGHVHKCTAGRTAGSTLRQAYSSLSQPLSITALWLVPTWWQRHMCVNNLPKVTTQQRSSWGSNSRPSMMP